MDIEVPDPLEPLPERSLLDVGDERGLQAFDRLHQPREVFERRLQAWVERFGCRIASDAAMKQST